MTKMTERRRAYSAIEDELTDLRSSTGVMYMAFTELDAHGQGHSGLAQSLHFAARGIEALCDRIEAKLWGEEEPAEPTCASHEETAL